MIQPNLQPVSEPFVVEVWGELAGVVLKDGGGFRFHAIAPPFLELDGARFTTPGHARLAAARLDNAFGRAAQSRFTARSFGKASHSANSLPL